MYDIARPIWFLYLISLPFVSAFSITQSITIPVVISSLLLFVVVFSSIIYVDKNAVVLFFLFVVPVILSSIVNIENSHEVKFINHFVSYVFTYIFFYFVPRQFLFFLDDRHKSKTKKAILCGWYLSILFCLFEFFVVNFFGVDVGSYIYRPAVIEYSPTVAGEFIRARSFAEESAHFALYAGIFYFILKAYDITTSNIFLLLIFSLVLSFGVASWFGFLLSLFYLMFHVELKKYYIKIICSFLFILFVVFMFSNHLNLLIFDEAVNKLSSGSAQDRMERVSESLDLYLNSGYLEILFGLGPGYYAWRNNGSLDSIVSLPWLTLFQNGAIGYVFLFLMFIKYFFVANSLNKNLAAAVIFSSICYLSISNYWLPWLWFLFAVIDDHYRVWLFNREVC